jgi:hypothetical protein
MAWLLALLAAFVLHGLVGGYIAGEKNRSPGEGFVLGFALGPLGLLVAVLMPTKPAPKPSRPRGAAATIKRRSVEGWQPPRDVIEEQDVQAFRFLVGDDPGRN